MVVTVKGNLVHKDDTDKVQKKILDVLEQKNNIVLDLKHVSMITSLGLGGIIRALRTVREKSGDLRLSSVNASVLKVFNITKLDEIIDVYETADDAVKSFD